MILIALAAVLAACGQSPKGSGREKLAGAGATVPLPYYNLAFKTYRDSVPAEVSYGGIGSGGGIRSLDTIQKYLDAGVERVILGTKAVTDPAFLEESLDKFGSHIAVGVDIKDGKIAIKGWLETAQDSVEDFFTKLCKLGVSTVICTDVSKDGMLAGTNVDLYRQLSQKFSLDLIASGGVSSQEDLTRLKELGLYGAILGKALYTGALDLKTALKEMEG